MSSNRQSTEQPWLRPPLVAGMVLAITVLVPAVVQAQSAESAFEPEQRSTIDTIPFRAIEEEALANTVIEGGLEAPAAGVPVQAGKDDDFYLDRSETPVDIRFSNPKVIPGQTHSNNYVIRPPENRTYDTFNLNMTERR
ncbi:hypothetical protein [uncultured Marinobacter sp.]|uniref:hypothetical protein n=1 Tax=uncultured Marinobacter sp. TaxID=187379 RepID=UPI00258C6EAD|nr:hypothetical protein [uncultured Marinobacter sp.]